MRFPPFYLLAIAYLLCSLPACVSYQELVNFEDIRAPRGQATEIENALEVKIQAKDLLRVDVESIDPEAALPFNQGGEMTGVSQASNQNIQLFQGYLVDEDGYIDLPLLGRVKAAGQTVESLQFLIRGKLKTYLRDPVVNVRFLNFKVTILGEVSNPGILNMSNSRVTILEALGMAGDLTDYANRSSILVVREQDGERSFQRINLQTDEVFNSEYYYLKQNDVIYVEPIRARTATISDPGQRVLAYLGPILSAITLVVALASRN
ncbi:polysaccharide export outer membrane protein [Lewinella marina]|uniref:Sugar transporter n=1 Tax=Neolewinella marina TaxID=438751 RepID=A0A2G0CE56_9BACT|nr:polysaccharide biosynthesis/export family protein [Neolewinella marina]NJB87439.1 polysaccharide export outer membrane protein [Neolewinella marina]PHK98252.1 sugar transporter [Neolewinella marina]